MSPTSGDGLSPRALARLAGALYLVNIVLGAFAIGYVSSAIGSDVKGHELLFRTGIAAHVIVTLTNVPLAVIFYELFKVVNRRLALLEAFFTLVATAVEVSDVVSQLATLSAAHSAGYDISTIFFGFDIVTLGYLVWVSSLVPRAIGVLLVVDAVAYVVYAFADILAPGFAAHLVPWIQLPALAGEGSLTVWLLVFGVDSQRWQRWSEQRS
jgi:uncharacterized protein DUF4386